MNFIKRNWIILMIIVVQFLLILWYLNNSNANIIYSDQFYIVDLIIKEYVKNNSNLCSILLKVWNNGGIHRGIGGAIFALVNLKVFRLNTFFEIYLSAFVLCITSITLFLYYKKHFKTNTISTKIFFVLISFIVFSLDQEELLIFGNGLSLFLRMFFFILIFIFFEKYIKNNQLNDLFIFITLLFLNTFLFSAGYTIPYIFSLFLIFLINYFINKSYNKKLLNILGILIPLFITLIVYSYGIFNTNSNYNFTTANRFIKYSDINFSFILSFIRFWLLSLSANIINVNLLDNHKRSINDLLLIVTAITLLFSYLYSIYIYFSNKIYKKNYLSIFFIIYSFVIYLIISLTRIGYVKEYPYYSMSSRYNLDTHYGLIGIFFIAVNFIFSKKKLRFIFYFIIIFIMVGQLISNAEELKISPYRKIYFNNLRRIALRGDYSNKNELTLFQNPNYKLIINSLYFLKQQKLNVFSDVE